MRKILAGVAVSTLLAGCAVPQENPTQTKSFCPAPEQSKTVDYLELIGIGMVIGGAIGGGIAAGVAVIGHSVLSIAVAQGAASGVAAGAALGAAYDSQVSCGQK